MPDSLKLIEREVSSCKKCPLYKTAMHGVPGEGPKNAKIFLIGQAPGREEDKTGRPFVGRSGRYLDAQLARIGLARSDVFISSVVKHFPPRNRVPTSEEIGACKPYVLRQLAFVDPKIVVLMGKVAEGLKDEGILDGKTVIVMPHPAAAMRFPKVAKRFERDFDRLRSVL